MKISRLLIVTLSSSLVLLSQGALATKNLNSSKSNVYKLDTTDQNAEKTCTDTGGKVDTNKRSQKICVKKAEDDAYAVLKTTISRLKEFLLLLPLLRLKTANCCSWTAFNYTHF